MKLDGIGKKIEKARKKKGLSFRAVAALTGLHRDTVKNIETGKHSGLIKNIEAIAHAVGLKI